MNTGPKDHTVLMVGCFDSKAAEYNLLHSILAVEFNVLTINTGIFEPLTEFGIDISSEEVASTGGSQLQNLRDSKDRGDAVERMSEGARKLIGQLIADQVISGAIGMGGGGGTYMVLRAFQLIPLGIPKICLSTVAAKDLSRQTGTRDIVLIPAVVDLNGLNRFNRRQISQAAGALRGMIGSGKGNQSAPQNKVIAISVFGNTTQAARHCTEIFEQAGYEVLTFHAVGIGGQTMESMIREGWVDGVLDLTITELADELCGGICSAGPDRLTAAAEMGIPQVVVPGCLDMVNFGHPDSVPERYADRQFYSWAPDVTLMRTSEMEYRSLGASIAAKLNKSSGKVVVCLPQKGLSEIGSKGGLFHAPVVDEELFQSLENGLRTTIQISRHNFEINNPEFSREISEILLQMLKNE